MLHGVLTHTKISVDVQKVGDMCSEKFPLVLMGGQAECCVCADMDARDPIGTSGIENNINVQNDRYLQNYSYFKNY